MQRVIITKTSAAKEMSLTERVVEYFKKTLNINNLDFSGLLAAKEKHTNYLIGHIITLRLIEVAQTIEQMNTIRPDCKPSLFTEYGPWKEKFDCLMKGLVKQTNDVNVLIDNYEYVDESYKKKNLNMFFEALPKNISGIRSRKYEDVLEDVLNNIRYKDQLFNYLIGDTKSLEDVLFLLKIFTEDKYSTKIKQVEEGISTRLIMAADVGLERKMNILSNSVCKEKLWRENYGFFIKATVSLIDLGNLLIDKCCEAREIKLAISTQALKLLAEEENFERRIFGIVYAERYICEEHLNILASAKEDARKILTNKISEVSSFDGLLYLLDRKSDLLSAEDKEFAKNRLLDLAGNNEENIKKLIKYFPEDEESLTRKMVSGMTLEEVLFALRIGYATKQHSSNGCPTVFERLCEERLIKILEEQEC